MIPIRYMYNGESLSLREIAARANINANTLTTRIYKYGLTAQVAADTPVKSSKVHTFTEVNQRKDGKQYVRSKQG